MILSPRDALLFSIATLSPEVAHASVPLRPELMAEISLRDYQMQILLQVAALMRAGHRRILIQLPCGGGKTVMAAAMTHSADSLGALSQFIVHRRELIEQTSTSFAGRGIGHSFVAAGFEMDLSVSVLLAGIQTLAKRLGVILPPNLVILDECHHCTSASWSAVLDAYPNAYIVGLTATPERLDGRGLGEHFDVMVTGPSVSWLIEQGYLAPYSYYAPSRPDLSKVPTLGGDFNQGAIGEVMDKPKLIGDTVEHYLRLARGERGIVFAVNREHSRRLADAFCGEGVRAVHVDSTMDKERKRAMDAFRAGDLDIMTNVDLFGEGVDVADCSYVGLDRPTQSRSLFTQQSMRPMRPAPKKRATICDHAGNAFTHGLPDDDCEYSLEGRKARPRGAGNSDATPIRQCLTCYRVSPSTVAVCPGCATPFPRIVREVEEEAGQLTKLERVELRKAAAKQRKDEERNAKSYEALVILGEQRGYEDPSAWAKAKLHIRKQYRDRFRSS